jgi:hypothetical protein
MPCVLRVRVVAASSTIPIPLRSSRGLALYPLALERVPFGRLYDTAHEKTGVKRRLVRRCCRAA